MVQHRESRRGLKILSDKKAKNGNSLKGIRFAKAKKATIVFGLIALITLLALPAQRSAICQETNEWSQFQRDASNTGYITLDIPGEGAKVETTAQLKIRDGSEAVVSGKRAFIYAGEDSSSGSIICYDLETNKLLWQTQITPPESWSWSSPAVSDGVVYIGSGKKVHALDVFTGKELWAKDLSSIKANALVCNSSPTIDGNYLYIGDYNNGCYYCLDVTKKGEHVWTFPLDANSMAASTPAVSGERVFVGQSAAFGQPPNGKVWCIDKRSGKPVTSWGKNGYFKTVNGNDVTGSVSVSDGYIYFNDFPFGSNPESYLYCLNEETGGEEWKARVLPTSGTPAVGNGFVVTAGKDFYGVGNKTFAFCAGAKSSSGGKQLWSADGIGGWNMSACIASGKVAVGIDDWSNPGIAILDLQTGKEIARINDGKSSPVPTNYGLLSVNPSGQLVIVKSEGAAQRNFYFAEGCTRRGYREYLCLENPTAAEIDITITYMKNDNSTAEQKVKLPKESRITLCVNDFLGGEFDVATLVSGKGEFIAERAMYVNTGTISGGEQVMGIESPKTEFTFAEGCTRGGYETWLALQNPGNSEANVLVTYFYGSGKEPKAKNYTLSPLSRQTINVDDEAGYDEDVSVSVKSNNPIVAERVMYFGTTFSTGVHNAFSDEKPEKRWYFAEGTTRDWCQEWLCILNPNGNDAQAQVKFLPSEGGEPLTRAYTLKANSRTTININAEVGSGKDISMEIEADLPVMCERPMYFRYNPGNPGEIWDGGHCTVGSRYSAYTYDLAEGTTRDGFQTYLCIANPGKRDAAVQITYFVAKDGAFEKKTQGVVVRASTRATIRVNDAIGQDADVSMHLESDNPIVVERPMYFNFSGFKGGGVSLGFGGS